MTTERRIVNPAVKDVITFLTTSEESAGERTLLGLELAPGGGTPPHFHDVFSERFEAVRGELTVYENGNRHVLAPGETAVAPVGALHHFRNETGETVEARIELRPGSSGFEESLRIAYGLAADGRTTATGIPRNPLHLALVTRMSDGRLPGLPGRVLGVSTIALVALARLLGTERRLRERYLTPW